jgi:hypothetical protein
MRGWSLVRPSPLISTETNRRDSSKGIHAPRMAQNLWNPQLCEPFSVAASLIQTKLLQFPIEWMQWLSNSHLHNGGKRQAKDLNQKRLQPS